MSPLLHVFFLSFGIGALGWCLGTTPEFFPALWQIGLPPEVLASASIGFGLVGMLLSLYFYWWRVR